MVLTDRFPEIQIRCKNAPRQRYCFHLKLLGRIALAAWVIPLIATHFSVAWSVICLSVCHIRAPYLNRSMEPPAKTSQTISPMLPPGEYKRGVLWTCDNDSAFLPNSFGPCMKSLVSRWIWQTCPWHLAEFFAWALLIVIDWQVYLWHCYIVCFCCWPVSVVQCACTWFVGRLQMFKLSF